MDVMLRADEVSLTPFLERVSLSERGLAEGRLITNVRVTKTLLRDVDREGQGGFSGSSRISRIDVR